MDWFAFFVDILADVVDYSVGIFRKPVDVAD
jgi:hypothetical protein